MTQPNTTTTIYLVRHGEYENPHNLFHGRLPGFVLSRHGKAQAEALAVYLATKPISAVYSSRLERAQETAQIIAQKFHLPVTLDERLLDVRSPLEGKPKSYIERIDSNLYTDDLIAAGGERLSEIFHRMDEFLREKVIKHHGGTIVVVSHGDPIMTVWTTYSGHPLPAHYSAKEWYVPMASGVQIHFDNEHAVQIEKLPSISTTIEAKT